MSGDAQVEVLRFTLAAKVRALRRERGLSLQQLAERSSLAVSYLSEIEKGRKYPKMEKLLDLARALGVAYEELVSPRLEPALEGIRDLVGSEWFREFPFHLFGLEPEDVFGLVVRDPERSGALLRTFLEVGQRYDVHVEQFLLAALRSYQQLNGNSFEELERAAELYRERQGWDVAEPPGAEALATALQRDHGYRLDEEALPAHPDLAGLRSVFVPGTPPQLLINGQLLPAQKAFVLARELGFVELGVRERPLTSSWLRVASFDEVLNNFRASYFAGALLIDRERLVTDLARWFADARFRPERLHELLARHRATPETLLHRLTELLPTRFGLRELFFLRFTQAHPGARPQLTKVYNMSRVPVPHGLGGEETYCRRWPALALLTPPADAGETLVDASRLRFQSAGAEFLVLTTSRPLSLHPGARSTVALGFLADGLLDERVRFVRDPNLPVREVNLSCERCPLRDCAERSAEPVLHAAAETLARREAALAALLAARRAPPKG